MRSIARNPALLDEAQRVAPSLGERAAPVEPAVLLARLIELAPVYGIQKRADQEWEAIYYQSVQALMILPMEAIEAAILDWNRQASWYPKPGELYQLALPYASTLRMAAYRAQKAVQWRDKHPRPKSDAERAADRQAAIDAGLLTPDGKIAPLNIPSVPNGPRKPPGSSETLEAARRVAAELAAREAPAPDVVDDEEEIV